MRLRCPVGRMASIHDQCPLGRSLASRQAGISKGTIERQAVLMVFAERLVSAYSHPGIPADELSETRYLFSSYGIEWPLLVWTDCRSGLSTIPLRLISSRKLLAVTGWPLLA